MLALVRRLTVHSLSCLIAVHRTRNGSLSMRFPCCWVITPQGVIQRASRATAATRPRLLASGRRTVRRVARSARSLSSVADLIGLIGALGGSARSCRDSMAARTVGTTPAGPNAAATPDASMTSRTWPWARATTSRTLSWASRSRSCRRTDDPVVSRKVMAPASSTTVSTGSGAARTSSKMSSRSRRQLAKNNGASNRYTMTPGIVTTPSERSMSRNESSSGTYPSTARCGRVAW